MSETRGGGGGLHPEGGCVGNENDRSEERRTRNALGLDSKYACMWLWVDVGLC